MAFEGLRDRWEGMQARERRLLLILGVTLTVSVFVWVGITIRDGLGSIEEKNETTRAALISLAQHRANGGGKAKTGTVEIPAEGVKLSRYLETIIKELSLKSPTYPQEKLTTKNGFTEASFTIHMDDLSIFELKDLLEKLETNNKVVVVRDLKIKRKLKDKEKLDVTMTVSTFKKAGKKDKAKDDGDDEEEEG
jgi:hypothetical protein